MTSHYHPHSHRRTSERRRLKLLRKTDEYRMINPFRQLHRSHFPQALSHQLRRYEFLSASVIAQLSFDARVHDQDCPESNLTRMHEAVNLQEIKYYSLLGAVTQPLDRHPPSDLEEGKGEPEEEVVQTKDEVSRNIYNIFDPRDPRREDECVSEFPLVGEGTAGMQASAGCMSGGATAAQLGLNSMLQEEYQNYFAS